MPAYTIACPININASTYDREKILENLLKAGASRLLLCGQSLTLDKAKLQKTYDKLSEEVKFYQSHGLEVWWWRWAFWVEGENPFTHETGFNGVHSFLACFLDPDFQELAFDDIRAIAATGVDGFLYDDDFRYNNGRIGLGCICHRHVKLAEQEYGKAIPLEGLEERAFHGKPNALRSALMKTWGDSIREFARKSREAAASVNPHIRFGLCACLTSYDADGATAMELSSILAGPTRPYARMIGAPYWVHMWSNMRIFEVAEFERMQASFMPENTEIFVEGDVYPRPRFKVPAALLEILDSATRFSGRFNGIQKYMFDYTSSMSYETGIPRFLPCTASGQTRKRLSGPVSSVQNQCLLLRNRCLGLPFIGV